LLPVRPAPPVGHDYSRADDGETTQPIAGRIPPHIEDGRAVVEVDPPWSPETGFFEPGRVPELVGDDLPEGFVPASAAKSGCDCIAYQGDHNCAAVDGCRCSEVFPTSAPCTCGHDFEDHESDEHGTGGPCQARFVAASAPYATFAEQREAYEREEAMRLPRCPNCRGRHHADEPCS
jgi:hypothetical protein